MELISRNAKPWKSSSPSDLKSYASTTPPDLIEGLIPSRAVVTFAGGPGIGKSFTALSWAAAIASGTSWMGREAVEAQPVVYVLGEGWSRFGRRVEAWEQAHGVELPEMLRFIDGSSEGIDLLNSEHIDSAIETLLSMERRPALVIFDTFAMLAGVRNENDNAEVGRVFNGAQRIVVATDATVVLVHHLSKIEGQVRGATAFRGNADTVVIAGRVKGDDEFFLSTMASDDGKQRDGEAEKIFGFSIASPGVLTHSDAVDEDRQKDQAATDFLTS